MAAMIVAVANPGRSSTVAGSRMDFGLIILGKVLIREHHDPAIAAVRAQIELAEASAAVGSAADLAAALEADPDNHQARFDLALALTGDGDSEGAIEALLELFRRDREWNDSAARVQLFKLFDSLGPKSEVAQKGRRKLSSMIFV
jgi:putative thioredoxin